MKYKSSIIILLMMLFYNPKICAQVPVLVKDINAGASGGSPQFLTSFAASCILVPLMSMICG